MKPSALNRFTLFGLSCFVAFATGCNSTTFGRFAFWNSKPAANEPGESEEAVVSLPTNVPSVSSDSTNTNWETPSQAGRVVPDSDDLSAYPRTDESNVGLPPTAPDGFNEAIAQNRTSKPQTDATNSDDVSVWEQTDVSISTNDSAFARTARK